MPFLLGFNFHFSNLSLDKKPVSFVLTTTAGGGLQQDGPTDNRGSMLNGRGVGRRHRKTIDGFFTFSFQLFSLFLVTFVQFVRETLLEKTRV